MYDGDAQYTEESTTPEWNDADAHMWTDDIHDPVWGQGGDAQNNEERNDIFFLSFDLVCPFVKLRFPFRKCEQCRAESGTDEIAEGCTCCDARTCKWERTWDTPDCTAEYGEIHGSRQGKCLQADGKISFRL